VKRVPYVCLLASLLLCCCWVALGPHYASSRPGPLTRAWSQIAALATALEAFQADNGVYPTTSDGLRALVEQPAGATNWHGPYAQDILKDPWGRDYVYEYHGKHRESGYPYDLVSLGPPSADTPVANWANQALKPWSRVRTPIRAVFLIFARTASLDSLRHGHVLPCRSPRIP